MGGGRGVVGKQIGEKAGDGRKNTSGFIFDNNANFFVNLSNVSNNLNDRRLAVCKCATKKSAIDDAYEETTPADCFMTSPVSEVVRKLANF